MSKWHDWGRDRWARLWMRMNLRWPYLFLLTLTFIVGFSFMIAATVVGLMQGARDAERLHRQSADFHYRQGLVYLQAGQRELAIAEFREALRFNPEHALAQRELLALLLPTPTPAPTPAAVVVPTPDPNWQWEQLFEEAKADLAAGRNHMAYLKLEQLHELAPDFRSEEVTDLLYRSAYEEGEALLAEDRLEEALRAFDRALIWRPTDPNARRMRDILDLYILGISYFYADWDTAINIFATLYREAPDFKDVRERYITALAEGAAYALRRNLPCQSVEYYRRLEALAPDRVPRDQYEAAERLCFSPTPTPTGP